MTTWPASPPALAAEDAVQSAQTSTSTPALTGSFMRVAQTGLAAWRFTNVQIPQGATVTNVVFRLSINSATIDNFNHDVYLQASDNAPALAAVAGDLYSDNRPLITPAIGWNAADTGTGYQSSPNLAALFNSLFARAGWASGNALVVLLYGKTGGDIRVVSDSGEVGTLQIEYTAGSSSHDLDVDNLDAGAPVLGTPTLVQAHSLTAQALAVGSPTLGAPTLAQVHTFDVGDIATNAPVLGAPLLVQAHTFDVGGLATNAPTLGAPQLGQTHDLTVGSLATDPPTLGAPQLAQSHTLGVSNLVTGSPTLGHPALSTEGTHALDVGNLDAGTPTLGAPALAQSHALAVSNLVTGNPTLGHPALTAGAVDGLDVGNLDAGAPTLGTPQLAQVHILVALWLATSAPALGSPALSQSHALTVSNLVTGGPTLGHPALNPPAQPDVVARWIHHVAARPNTYRPNRSSRLTVNRSYTLEV